jgi:hypothetical protein
MRLSRPGQQKKRRRGVKVIDPNSHTRRVSIKRLKKRWGN